MMKNDQVTQLIFHWDNQPKGEYHECKTYISVYTNASLYPVKILAAGHGYAGAAINYLEQFDWFNEAVKAELLERIKLFGAAPHQNDKLEIIRELQWFEREVLNAEPSEPCKWRDLEEALYRSFVECPEEEYIEDIQALYIRHNQAWPYHHISDLKEISEAWANWCQERFGGIGCAIELAHHYTYIMVEEHVTA